MMKDLTITRFGNPILRAQAKKLSDEEILSDEIQQLIVAMYDKLRRDKFGVGLAAPQIGKSIAMSVIGIKPTPNRPERKPFDTVIVNPSYEGIGKKSAKWEGCISAGKGDDTLFAQVPRYSRIRARWQDEKAKWHEDVVEDFVAHVFQHEADHLNGVLFVDKVEDTKTYMMSDEYRARIIKKRGD